MAYKTGWIKKLINGVSTKVFAFAHVKTVYYDYANSKTLKTKLDEMDTSISGKAASNHTHNNFVKSGSGAKAGFVPAPSTTAGTTKYLREDGTWNTPPNTTYSDATTSAHGLMSAADKTKLNCIATGANKTTVDSAISSTSTNPVQNKVVYAQLNKKSNTDHIHHQIDCVIETYGHVIYGYPNSAAFMPEQTGTSLGYAGGDIYKWKQVVASSSTIVTSDRNLKKNISELSDNEKFIAFFEKLIPVSFQFIDGSSGRTHVGFIAQDVENAMEEVGMSDLQFAGFCKDVKIKEELDDDGNITYVPDLDKDGNEQYIYSLRYEEFIALNTLMIQKNKKRLEELEQRVEKLYEHIGL